MLGRMYDAIEYRGSSQEAVEELARYAGVPVLNGLTDRWHPTQMLADVLTMREHLPGRPLPEIAFAYLGDARYNMGNSYLITGALLGMDVRIVAPEGLWPDEEIVGRAKELAAHSAPGSRSPRTWRRVCAARTSSPPTSGSRWGSPRRSGTSASRCSAGTPSRWTCCVPPAIRT